MQRERLGRSLVSMTKMRRFWVGFDVELCLEARGIGGVQFEVGIALKGWRQTRKLSQAAHPAFSAWVPLGRLPGKCRAIAQRSASKAKQTAVHEVSVEASVGFWAFFCLPREREAFCKGRG